jgi:hypothetical protein
MKLLEKDTFLLLSLIGISFISVYYMPMMMNRIIFLLILIIAYRTTYDYVLLLWFFIINDAPGRLFSGSLYDDIRIPLYPITEGISVSFQDLFLIVYIIKFINARRPFQFIFKNEFIMFYMVGFIVVLYSFIIGMSFNTMIINFRYLFPWTLLFIIPVFIYNKEIVVRVSYLIFLFVFLALFAQTYSFIVGTHIDYYLRGVEFISLAVDESESASRAASSVYLILFCIIQGLYFLFSQNTDTNKNYLGLVITIALLAILLSATRGWIIAFVVLLLGVFILFGFTSEINKTFRLIILSIVLFIAFSQIPIVQKQADRVFDRVMTLEYLARGDITAGDTLHRLNVRSPRVMKKFWERPILGWGFSDEFHEHQDGHVGNQNILLNVGIVGYFFLIAFFVHICLKIYNISQHSEIRLNEGKTPLIYILSLLAVFIIHSSSTQFWGYIMAFDQLPKVVFFGFFFASVNVVFQNCWVESDE